VLGKRTRQVLRANVSSQQFWKKGLQGAWHQPGLVSNDLVDGYRRPSTVQDWDEGLLRFVEANTLKLGDNGSTTTTSNTANGTASATLTEKLAALVAAGRTRVLVVHGKQDRLVPLSNSRRLAKAVGARCVEIDACGHVPMEEAPVEFLNAVRQFVGANK
jgi:pimeloyl-ACP methyl ester carboxylesterase